MSALEIDVLCVGHACYDLIFSVAQQPLADEKIVATDLLSCGGGPAANAAVAIAKLGFQAAFAGYLGNDLYGDKHCQEFVEVGVNTDLVKRNNSPTPLSTVLVKPDGKRSLINYKGNTDVLAANSIDFSAVKPKVILLDGHQPLLSPSIIEQAKQHNIPTVLDAGSLHTGTKYLIDKVDYLVASEKFAKQYAGDVESALTQLAKLSANVVITLGEKGLIWQQQQQTGSLTACKVEAIDTTGAGDAFHGAFAAAVAAGKSWNEILKFASVAGSLCCSKIGARLGLPSQAEHQALYASL